MGSEARASHVVYTYSVQHISHYSYLTTPFFYLHENFGLPVGLEYELLMLLADCISL